MRGRETPEIINVSSFPAPVFRAYGNSKLKRILFAINKRTLTKGRRFFARVLCTLVPPIKWTQFDVENARGMRARIVFDNLHDYWFLSQGNDFETDFQTCFRIAMAERAPHAEFNYLDLGANSGLVASLALRIGTAAGGINIVAVEPQRALIPRIIANLGLNGGNRNCSIFNCALGESFGTVSIKSTGTIAGEQVSEQACCAGRALRWRHLRLSLNPAN
jgi:hypothetical protein